MAACTPHEDHEPFRADAVAAIAARDPGSDAAYVAELVDATRESCGLPFRSFVAFVVDMRRRCRRPRGGGVPGDDG